MVYRLLAAGYSVSGGYSNKPHLSKKVRHLFGLLEWNERVKSEGTRCTELLFGGIIPDVILPNYLVKKNTPETYVT